MTAAETLADAADALWRFQARGDVLLEMRARDHIDPRRCAAEFERLWQALAARVEAREAPCGCN
ncbi:MAG: hypothetical protein ACF8R7_00140 [Phycisphaerales bacterium JB039]